MLFISCYDKTKFGFVETRFELFLAAKGQHEISFIFMVEKLFA